MVSTIDTDWHVAGNLSAKTMDIPAGTIKDAAINSSAAINPTKCIQRHTANHYFGDDPATQEIVLAIVRGATGTMRKIALSAVTAPTVGTLTIDLKKNGSSILSSTFTITTAQADREVVTQTIQTPDVNVDDIITLSITNASSFDGKKVSAQLLWDEDPL